MARTSRRDRPPASRPSVSAPVAGKPKGQSGGEPVPRSRGVRGIGQFGGEIRSELAKVDFPDRQQTIQATFVVIGACIVVGAYLYGLDQLFALLVRHLVDLQK
jgi:preprotein translocase subunit SecE